MAGTRRPNTPDEKYLKYGEDFKYVLSICGIYDNNELFMASCVAISPDWVLTAAHVIKNAKHCGVSASENEAIIVDQMIIHHQFDDSFGVGDIALCHLKKPLKLDYYPELYDGEDEVGKVCCISGFGLTGTFLSGQKESDGKRRAGSNIIDFVMKDLLICTPSKDTKLTELEFLIASGDSGGGLFIDGKLAGINSCVMAEKKSPNSVYGDEGGHTRVSKFIPWIKEKTKLDIK